VTGESPQIKTQIYDEFFRHKLTKVSGSHSKLSRMEREIMTEEQDLEKQLLDIDLFYLVQPEYNAFAPELQDSRLKELA
jgi:hypothetical protein